VPVDRDQADAALDAWITARAATAPLNFGDCLIAYALASLRGARLLSVGDDFARTDAAEDLG
jgi:uncharacterized protein with PIN domain